MLKFRAMRSFRHGTSTFGRGDVVDVSEQVAKDLIQRGLVKGEGTKPKRKRSERAAPADRTEKKPA